MARGKECLGAVDDGGAWRSARVLMPEGKMVPRDIKHSFTMSKLFSTAYEAKAVAVDEATAWTDQRLIHFRPQAYKHQCMTRRGRKELLH